MTASVIAAGMVTPVGFSASSSCAAIRAQLDGFVNTRFRYDDDWLTGGVVELPSKTSGRLKELQMALSAADECMAKLPPGRAGDTALALCVAERDRQGRVSWMDRSFFDEFVGSLCASDRLNGAALYVEGGALGALDALIWTDTLLAARDAEYCVVVGVDSYLHLRMLDAFHAQRRLVTAQNADGFIPGESAAAIALSRESRGPLVFHGAGRATEPSVRDSGHPATGEGLSAAYRDAIARSGIDFDQLDYRLTDLSGSQDGFKEAAFALGRTMRVIKDDFPMWSPGECVGRVGAASIPLMIGVALASWEKRYAPGPGVLCHASGDDGQRGAWILRGRT